MRKSYLSSARPFQPSSGNRPASAKRNITSTAFQAASNIPGYNAGDFTALWIQAKSSSDRRYHRVGPNGPEPITVSALDVLPVSEHLEYYSSGESMPTIIARAQTLNVELQKNGNYRINAQPDDKLTAKLTDDTGSTVAVLRREATVFTNTRVRYLGQHSFIPPPLRSRGLHHLATPHGIG